MARFSRRVVALAALVTFATSLALPLVSTRHALADDPDVGWGGRPLVSAHAVARLNALIPSDASEHCAICHWMRALGSSITSARLARPVLTRALAGRIDLAAPVTVSPAESGPARAPPSSLT